MTDIGIEALEPWVKNIAATLQPAERKKVLRKIMLQERRSTQKRITAQENPEGKPWGKRKPRRSKKGRIKKQKKMMLGFRPVRRLKMSATADQAEIGYRGRTSSIARVHQFGLVDRVSKRGPLYKYPERKILGFSHTQLIGKTILDHIAEGAK